MQLIENISKEKLRGGFYTPEAIVDFILKWSMNTNKDYKDYDILEPGCGDGAFLRGIKKIGYQYRSITAIEITKEEAEKARKIDLPNLRVLNEDFLKYCNLTNDRFDLIVGNPPYIRYQYITDEQQLEAEKIFRKAGLKYSKLTNLWAIFVVGSCTLLKEHGKMGFVLPAELLQVSYAKPLRNFLAQTFNKINIISFRKLVFPNIQQEVILLLCEKNNSVTYSSLSPVNISHRIEHLELENGSELEKIDVTKLKSPKKRVDFRSNKWTFYFLKQEEIDFIEKLLNNKVIYPIKHYATVEVGITTGNNKFFTVPYSIVKEYNLYEYAKPMVGRSIQALGIIFTKEDWKKNVDSGKRAYFLKFPTVRELKENRKALEYIKEGEKKGIHKGYKCSIRDEWQIVPSAWVSEALFIRRNNLYPKLILNQAKAYTTDTMHRVMVKKYYDTKAFVASFYNSLSFAFSEICGRSYGGGALELMPNEVEQILLPYRRDNAKILKDIDKAIREKQAVEEILKFTNEIILKEGYDLTDAEIGMANNIWKKLLRRRVNRKKN